MSGNSKKLIAFNYFGGKFSLADKLEKFFPQHVHFIDLFMGSMAVTLNKSTSPIETANDINGDIVNFFSVFRDTPDQLISLLKLTPVSREEFNKSWHTEGCTDIERARRFYVRIRQSFCGMGAQRQNKGWHMVKTKSRANMGETISKWHGGIEKLYNIIDRLTHIQIENRHFRDVISAIDFPDAFFYCDPPYPRDVRSSYNDYKFEFTNTDHEELSELLHGIEGKAMISGYDGPTMASLYRGWVKVKFPIKHNNIRHKQVQEVIWMNYEPTYTQTEIFKRHEISN